MALLSTWEHTLAQAHVLPRDTYLLAPASSLSLSLSLSLAVRLFRRRRPRSVILSAACERDDDGGQQLQVHEDEDQVMEDMEEEGRKGKEERYMCHTGKQRHGRKNGG